MLDHVLDLALHCQEKESEEVDQKDGPVVSVHSGGGVTGDFVRDTALCQKTGTSNIEKKVIKKAVHTPFIEVYQNLNSGTRRLNGLKLSPVEVGNKGPSPSGSIWGERNPMKLFSRKIPKPYVTMNHPCIIYTLRP